MRWNISPVPLPPPRSHFRRGTWRDERCDNTMRGNLDAVSKLARIDGIDESRIFTVSSVDHTVYLTMSTCLTVRFPCQEEYHVITCVWVSIIRSSFRLPNNGDSLVMKNQSVGCTRTHSRVVLIKIKASPDKKYVTIV